MLRRFLLNLMKELRNEKKGEEDYQLAEEHLFEVYQKNIRVRMNEFADAIATGNAQDYAEYKKMVGVIEGLALAERELLDWVEAMRKGEE